MTREEATSPPRAGGTAFVVSFHDTLSGTCEVDLAFEANAKALFNQLQTVPTVADAQLFRDGQMIQSWKRQGDAGRDG